MRKALKQKNLRRLEGNLSLIYQIIYILRCILHTFRSKANGFKNIFNTRKGTIWVMKWREKENTIIIMRNPDGCAAHYTCNFRRHYITLSARAQKHEPIKPYQYFEKNKNIKQ